MGTDNNHFWFPGRWIGGVSLLLAPPVLCVAIISRLPFPFFFPEQLKAYQSHPQLMAWSYQLFLMGNLLLWPGILTLVRQIGLIKSRWATWGGAMVIAGLFARTFHAGVDHLAFQLVRLHDWQFASKIIADAYGAFHVVSLFNLFIMLGWIILAIGAYNAQVFGLVQSIALGMMSLLMIGVLKGSAWTSIVAVVGLCIAMVTLGIKVITTDRAPGVKTIATAAGSALALVALLYWFGQQG